MLVYFLKSSACLAIFMLFYALFLEKESVHKFKRFYLMTSVLLAFVIPLVTFTEIVEVSPSAAIVTTVLQTYSPEIARAQNTNADYLPFLLWSIYFLGVSLFAYLFLKNLYQIFQRIRNNPKNRTKNIIQVLLNDPIIPHTFFQYIFLNKNKFEAKEIPEAVLLHEEVHAIQKHSLDVIFIELLQVLFWFNPLLYALKKAIKLNHEFLADQAVVKTGIPTGTYQSLLLAFSSNDPVPQLANSINYSSTRLTLFGKTFRLGLSTVGQVKKRISVMKKQTSKKSLVLRSAVLLPLLAVLLFGFGNRELVEVVKDPISRSTASYLISEDIIIHINKNGNLLLQDKAVEITDLYNSLLMYNADLSKEERSGMVRAQIYIAEETPGNILHDTEKILKSYGVATINLYGDIQELKGDNHINNQDEGKIKININHKGQILVNNAFIENIDLIDYLKHFLKNKSSDIPNDKLRGIIIVTPNTPKSLIKKAEIALSHNGIRNITLEGSTPPYYDFQEKATPKMIGEYNGLAKKYNAQPKATRRVPLNDLKTLEDIYRVMTPSQKDNAEPFPDCAPPPGQEPATKKQLAEYNALAKEYNAMIKKGNVWIKKPEVDHMKSIYILMTDAQKEKAEPFPNFPPPPLAPKTPSAPQADARAPIAPSPPRQVGPTTHEPPLPPSPPDQSEKEIAEKIVQEIIENQDPYDELNGNITPRMVTKEDESLIQPPLPPININDREPAIPPAPPEPKSPLDHVIEMVKKGAVFYYEGKEITSDKAIEILKENKHININSTSKGQRPVVKLSTEPIEIEN